MIRTALIVTSLVGAGLEQEARLLKTLLEAHGVTTTLLHYTDMTTHVAPVDVMFSFEVVMPRSLGLAERNYLFPNSEWWPPHNDQYLPRFHKILCKTQDCFEIWSRKEGMDRCAFTSFEARDLYDPYIVRKKHFLHVFGKSECKGTDAVLTCWRVNKGLPPLTVVGDNPKFNRIYIPSMTVAGSPITHYSKVPDNQLRELMNSHTYHIIPSEYEGFGHVIHEGLGCNAQVVTTDAPPMNSYNGIIRAALVPIVKQVPQSLAILNKVDAAAVYKAIKALQACVLFDEDRPRRSFLANQQFFRQVLWSEINQ